MDKIAITKFAVRTIVGMGAATVIKTIIKNNVVAENPVQAVMIAGGTFALGGMVSEAAGKFTDRQIDDLVTWWNENIKKTVTE